MNRSYPFRLALLHREWYGVLFVFFAGPVIWDLEDSMPLERILYMRLHAKVFLPLLSLASLYAQDPRVTPAVRLIEKVRPAIVPIFAGISGDGGTSGTGAVIHEGGYILTADHVTRDRTGVAIFGLTRVPYRIVGRLPERDLAILKVDLPRRLTPIPLGRSHDLRAGEPIIVGGNPGGRGVVFSQGTINAPSIEPTMPSILHKTYLRDEQFEERLAAAKLHSAGGRPDYIQFDAMSNKGNSGGPVLNILGELIGIVVQKSQTEESINWAIPVDRIRLWFPYFLEPEEKGGIWTGVTTDLLGKEARVVSTTASSPAAEAGIENGDIIETVDRTPLRSGLDWLLSLGEHKRGDSIRLNVRRGGSTLGKNLILADYPAPAFTPPDGKRPGVKFSVYRGKSQDFDSFKDRTLVEEGIAASVSVDKFKSQQKEHFAVVFEGYLEFPQAGLHRIWVGADDGARLFLNGRLIIDNGLTHPYQELSRSIRVPKGLVPLRIEYFESIGAARLTVSVRHEDSQAEPTTDLKFWCDPG